MILFPRSVETAWWLTAWLRGHAAADDVVAALTAEEVVWYAESRDAAPLPLIEALGRLRGQGVTEVGATLTGEGDPLGLGGPAAVNQAVLEAGEALTGPGFVLVPEVLGSSVTWLRYSATNAPVPDIGEASRGMRQVVNEIVRMSVMPGRRDAPARRRFDPDLADEMLSLARTPELDPPPGIPARCVTLAAQGWQTLRIAHLAADTHEHSLSAQSRLDMERAARRALAAAATPAAWPPD